MSLGAEDNWLSFVLANSPTIAALVIALYVLAAVCAIREVMNSRTSQGSIAWLLSLVILPFPAAFLYLVFGWKLFDDYAALQTHSGRKARITRAKDLYLLDLKSNKEWPVLAKVSELPFLSGNTAELLIDGEATFKSIFEGISKAKVYVLAQFYIIRDDALGREFAERLMERARAGVAVYLIYDDVGCFWLKRAYINRLREAGVRVGSFNQRHKSLRLYGPARINYRSHRKVVVVDGDDAWVGGHNVGVEYLGQDKRFGKWRDTHVHVGGPAALSCALVFREDWQWATGEVLPGGIPSAVETPGDQSVLVMPSGPADTLEECAIAFTEVISRARQRLWIVSPYFVPDLDIQTALHAAALRGVDVRVLIPKRPDHLLVWLASNAHANSMVAHDVAIYRYGKGFLHQKVVLVDDAIASVGTVNFDNRSFAINFELTLWFTGEQIISDIAAMLEKDFSEAHLTTMEEVRSTPWIKRFVGQAAKLFSPIL